jgi:3-phenylpropionate/cinnamic acid dioxygenase small subunit
MNSTPSEVTQLLALEALYLDERRWDDWLSLYTEDCLFWLPTWLDEGRLGKDPETELSFIYLEGRTALKERVWRIKSGQSRASRIGHRTAHVIGSPVVLEGPGTDECRALASGAVHVFHTQRSTQHCFFGRYEYTLRREAGAWRIARKHITLMNDRIPTFLDIHFV